MRRGTTRVLGALALILFACGHESDDPITGAGTGDAADASSSTGSEGTAAGPEGDDTSSTGPAMLELGDRCVDWQDACGPGLRCLFETCTWACGWAGQCCPAGLLCGGIEYECLPPAPDWCGDPCDGQAWAQCDEGEECVLDDDGIGQCVAR